MFKAVSLVPLGSVRQDVIDAIAGGIYENLQLEVFFEEPASLPQEFFDPARGQFKADDLVTYFQQNIETRSRLKLGICEADLYAWDLNFVFGISILKQGTALLSYKRLDNKFYNLPPNDRLLYERAQKEALHELGHAIGLDHCEAPCVMHYSNSVMEVDVKPAKFCPECWRRLNLLLGRNLH
ncbi:archaemetzincin [Thermodesulfatator autotrophicus]|uniref:Peptidase zinc-dependent n=1 Tax=Thermodesulfatator autotrophicus TaxID=1795632 RepID=A0A177EAW8_9BACT|nr:archaemetzincin [Thermodesulfatator autotrophicus]OAG28332.1 hypothetical protein TH606_02405 [Thermodesulfatator autotrophicus]